MNPFDRYFSIGERCRLGSHRFDADAIIAFARKYDPQRFHVDAEAAKDSVFGRLCASGWHTTAIWMKKNIEHQATLFARWRGDGLVAPEFGPSPGFRNLRWLRPVFAGETMTFYLTVAGGRALASRPGWYLMEMIGEAETDDAAPVLRFEPAVMIRFPAG